MPQLASDDLNSINRKLETVLEHCQSCSNVTPETLVSDFQILRQTLMQAGKLVRYSDGQNDPALDGELIRYRRDLEALRQWLPSIQIKLEMEKSRLGKTLDHLQIASAWAVANRETLR